MKDRPTILIVDDEPLNRELLNDILEDSYNLLFAENGLQEVELAKKHVPDLILSDVTMPEMDGLTACMILNKDPVTKDIPIIMLTALGGQMDEAHGFDVGAVDYIQKPASPPIVRRRIKTHLSLVKTEKLDKLARESIHMLGDAGHYNDTDTGAHIWRMAAFSARLAKELGWNHEHCKLIEMAAPMHDTGKIGIPDSILKAERKLTLNEWAEMRRHCLYGYEILNRSKHPVFQLAAVIALNHHEKWDGTGYPNGLKGDDIPEAARIVAVADVFDALTMKRSYKDAWPVEDSIEYIKNSRGLHFEPAVVDAFINCLDDIIEIKAFWDSKAKQDGDGFIDF